MMCAAPLKSCALNPTLVGGRSLIFLMISQIINPLALAAADTINGGR